MRECHHGPDAEDHRSPPPELDGEAQRYWKDARAFALLFREEAGDSAICLHATAKVAYWENHERHYPHLTGE